MPIDDLGDGMRRHLILTQPINNLKFVNKISIFSRGKNLKKIDFPEREK